MGRGFQPILRALAGIAGMLALAGMSGRPACGAQSAVSHRLPGIFLVGDPMDIDGRSVYLTFYAEATSGMPIPKVTMDALAWEASGQAKEKEGHRLHPVKRINLWADAFGYDVCELPGGGQALLVVRRDGIWNLLSGQPLLKASHAFIHPRPLGFRRLKICFQAPAVGGLRLILPRFDSYGVYSWNGVGSQVPEPAGDIAFNAFQRSSQRPASFHPGMAQHHVNMALPDLIVQDLDGDHELEYVVIERNRLRVFSESTGKSSNGVAGAQVVGRGQLRLLHSQPVNFHEFAPGREESNVQVFFTLADAGGPGSVDLIVAKVKLSLFSPVSKISRFPYLASGGFAPTADASIDDDSVFLSLVQAGAGFGSQAILGKIDSGLGTIAGYLMSKKVEVDFVNVKEAFARKKTSPFTTSELGLDVSGAIRVRGGEPFWGIYGPEQRPFVVFPEDGNSLAAYSLNPGINGMGERMWTIPVELGQVFDQVDFNRDGLFEYVLAFPGDEALDRKLLVVFPEWGSQARSRH